MKKRFSRALLHCALALPLAAGAQTLWTNPGTSDWFNASNWNPAAVPTGGTNVMVSNGGTASLAGVPGTPLLGSLEIGLAGNGTGTGGVISNGVNIDVTGFLRIGRVDTVGNFADGQLTINGAGGGANVVNVGVNFFSVSPAIAIGRLDATGTFLSSQVFTVGQSFGAASGSNANGTVVIGGNAGAAQFLIVGDTASFSSGQVGSQSTGAARIGGNVTMTQFGSIGTAAAQRVADSAAPGGFRFDRADGTVTIDGALSVADTATTLSIGTTGGGVVTGALSAKTLNMAPAAAFTANIGSASTGGQASGSLSVGSGDFRVASNDTNVGVATEGAAFGTIALGGQLVGGGGALNVGTLSSLGTMTASAQGTIDAAGGVSGFGSYNVGTITNSQAAGSSAIGSVAGGSSAPSSSTTNVRVGTIFNSVGGPVTASGNLTLGNSLNLANGDFVVGEVFPGAPGSAATGTANIAGDLGTARFFVVGNALSLAPSQTGIRATGIADVGGNVNVSSLLMVGTESSVRVADPSAAGGVRFDQAQGAAAVAGTLNFANGANVSVGSAREGVADGALRVGAIAGNNGSLNRVLVGTSSTNGQGTGSFEINGGTLRAASLDVGTTTAGTAAGRLALTNANLQVNTVVAGTGGGTAQLLLTDSQSIVNQDMSLTAGLLRLERAQLTVGNSLALGDDALTHVEIDGLLRGTAYGAIDALTASIDGDIEFDFGDLVFGGESVVFDILRSGSANGINGDFDSFNFFNMLSGYSATAGVELDGSAEVYRVTLTRNAVAAPSSALLLLIGIGSLICPQRRSPIGPFVP